jgi:hypothetical protein
MADSIIHIYLILVKSHAIKQISHKIEISLFHGECQHLLPNTHMIKADINRDKYHLLYA